MRHNWTREQAGQLFELPFLDLVYRAQQIHRAYFDSSDIQISTLLSIKTGGCPEDCAYCPQSVHHDTDVPAGGLMEVAEVRAAAQVARQGGATRFCMGAAWRNPREQDMGQLAAMVREVKGLGMETCMTLGMLDGEQVRVLREAGLDYYNHNLDTSREYYPEIITTRDYQERLDTLANVRAAGIKVCCGGIVGMGESREDRVGLLVELANQPRHPESVPINLLVRVEGTPLDDCAGLDPLEFVRTIAVARIMMPASRVRLSAGREEMSDEMQTLCFMAGANSVFYGDRLLTTPNPAADHDHDLFRRLGLPFPEPAMDTVQQPDDAIVAGVPGTPSRD